MVEYVEFARGLPSWRLTGCMGLLLPSAIAHCLSGQGSRTILVWGEDRKNVGALPVVGSHVCAKGQITDYHGVPEIVVKSSGQLNQ
jgi:hypothetical protein